MTQTTQKPTPVQSAPQPAGPINVKEQPSGGLSVTFQITKQDADRLRRKAGGMALDRFIWQNIIHSAVEGFLY